MTVLSVSVTARDSPAGSCTVLKLVGAADVTTPGLHDALEAEVAEKPCLLVVDMSELSFIDSSALAAVIWAHRKLTAAGCTLALACPSDHVARILQLVDIAQVIPVYDSVQAAAAGLGRWARPL
ncbi:MAG TPA: STAS domain-containing protein [Trebonia sp.]